MSSISAERFRTVILPSDPARMRAAVALAARALSRPSYFATLFAADDAEREAQMLAQFPDPAERRMADESTG